VQATSATTPRRTETYGFDLKCHKGNRASARVTELSAGVIRSLEQATGIAQISSALFNLEQMNQQNADSAVHTSVSSLQLNRRLKVSGFSLANCK